MRHADELAPQNALDGVIVCEGDGDAAHGDVAEDDRQQKGRQDEKHIQLPVLPDIHQGVVDLGASALWDKCANGGLLT